MIHATLVRRRALGRCGLSLLASLLALSAQAGDRYWPPIVDPPTGKHPDRCRAVAEKLGD